MRATAVLAIGCLSWSVACVGTSPPTAPTPLAAQSPRSSAALTVRVLTRTTEQPITGATVFQNRDAVGLTDGGGELRTNVPVGVEFAIDVSAPGFVGFGAAGTVNGEERWTFYLEPGQPGS